jgi:hypothetical protein
MISDVNGGSSEGGNSGSGRRGDDEKTTGDSGGPPSGDTCGDRRGLALRGKRGPTGLDFGPTPLGFPARGDTVTRGCAALHPGLT